MGRPSNFTKEEDRVIIEYYSEHTSKEMATLLPDKSVRSISNRARTLGVSKNWSKKSVIVYDNNELKLSKLSNDKLICRKAPKNSEYRKYTLNDEYFSVIDNDEKAYWLGFIYADGYIYNRVRNNGRVDMRLELGLAATDAEHIHKFRYCIGTNKPLQDKTAILNGKRFKSNRLTIYGKEFVGNLIDKGLYQNKSLSLVFPNTYQLPEKYYSSFIRGYFDGDGCIFGDNDRNMYQLNIVGTENMLMRIKEILNRYANLPNVVLNKKGNAYQLHWGGYQNIYRYYKYAYKNSTISLERKRKHFEEIINTKFYKRLA